MKCPYCGGKSNTINTRHSDGMVRRRHECRLCQKRFSTFEIYAQDYKNTKSIIQFVRGIRDL